MITISRPLSAAQALTYHKTEFTNREQSYYSQGSHVSGEWQGKLATQWGLIGEVREEQFSRLANGQHPQSGEQLVEHRVVREYTNAAGETVKAMEHRAGWDATFSAPKSVSLTALVGGDERVREAHHESVRVALDEMERFVQARIGGNHVPETTGKWVAAKFEHDSARPVDGYSAPQLHTHVVFFNVTETPDGKTHAIQPREVYKSQQYGTAVYQSELAWRLKALGYEIEAGRNHAPEIKGYSREYLEASSPRSKQIRDYLEEKGFKGAGPAQIAAHQTRDAKIPMSSEEMHRRHEELAAAFGNQARRVVEAVRGRSQEMAAHQEVGRAGWAVTYARDRNFEREAVADERDLLRDALKRSMGELRLEEIRANFESRIGSGEFVHVGGSDPGGAGRDFTTAEMLDYERKNIGFMKEGHGRYERIAEPWEIKQFDERFKHLGNSQRLASEKILSSRDQVFGLQGRAGSGKTATLDSIRHVAAHYGYDVQGFAPTSRAAKQLEDAGIESKTLQAYLAAGERSKLGSPTLYVVDEASLASTKQMHEFLSRLRDEDRVLLVGDVRQHQAVEAGRPFEQLQQAGMTTARLDEIIRQRDVSLKAAVEHLSKGDIAEGLGELAQQGRVHQFGNREDRFDAISSQYLEDPQNTLVVSPDNWSRFEINNRVHAKMQARGIVGEDHKVAVYLPRQDLTGADRQWAAKYEPGDIVRYSQGSRKFGLAQGEYARVEKVDVENNLLAVEAENGRRVTYNPHELKGVNVYREAERYFGVGDRVQFTAKSSEFDVPNRELGTLKLIDENGNLAIRFDSGDEVKFSIEEHRHLDYGYAVTSYSSQSHTVDRVIVHVEAQHAHENLVNRRFAYVSVSRGRYDAQIYTDDIQELKERLSYDHSKTSALSALEKARSRYENAQEVRHEVEHSHGRGLQQSR